VVAQLTQFIGGAQHSLDLAIYDLKHPDVLGALKNVAGRIKLRIAYDGGKQKAVTGGPRADPKPGGTEQSLRQAGLIRYATAVHVAGGHLMHSKYMIRDGTAAWTGSGNWTHGGLDLQDNNYLVIQSPEIAKAYEMNFTGLIAKSHTHLGPRARAARPSPRTIPPAVVVGKTPITAGFAGGGVEAEGIEEAVVRLLKPAKSVRVIAMLVSDPGILQGLAAFKGPRNDIRGILDPHEMKQVMHPPKGKSKTDPKLFWFANGDRRFVAAPSHAYSPIDNNDFMHNKIIILDERIVITGSYNFSENAESNDENQLIIESKDVAAAYLKYFDALYAQYQKHGAPLPPQ
jgi:phosphatidylserine/phosphatidylglycerophosphate/cardiolipin synthase-like enzyme